MRRTTTTTRALALVLLCAVIPCATAGAVSGQTRPRVVSSTGQLQAPTPEDKVGFTRPRRVHPEANRKHPGALLAPRIDQADEFLRRLDRLIESYVCSAGATGCLFP